eukprot:298659-Pyramimonas_sp.AAC.1
MARAALRQSNAICRGISSRRCSVLPKEADRRRSQCYVEHWFSHRWVRWQNAWFSQRAYLSARLSTGSD